VLREHFDVLIVGAGLSGVGAAYALQRDCPKKTYAILEARDRIGGTWDLFRYPGIRSDSDMYTLGYSFRPWNDDKALADGPAILEYIRQTATENGIERNIRFHHQVKAASWSSDQAVWTVQVERVPDPQPVEFTCQFLFSCSGYYSYAQGYSPAFPGAARYTGTVIHPQNWPQSLDYAGKRIVVIGSGATAVTLIPALARTAAHVTMLQRSPTYVVSAPNRDGLAQFMRRRLPRNLAYRLVRWRNVLFGAAFYQLSRRHPQAIRNFILKGVRAALGPEYDVATHFTPRYNPWDQRLCLVPDGDLFHSIRTGSASVCTGEIETFTERGVRLKDGRQLEADIIVTATGLNVVVLGNMQISVDGQMIDISRTLGYKGCMYSGIPNLAVTFGYTNASWTLKCELTCNYVARLLNYMDRSGRDYCVPQNEDPSVLPETWLNLTSGYIQRVADRLPQQGSKRPWRVRQNYFLDLLAFKFGAIDDGVLRFGYRRATASPYQPVGAPASG
jgi:cation diffusion facilitator CzcD-associated flavoprotein CzcO